MKVDDWVYTPRFCGVRIEKIFNSMSEAYENRYTEPTHYHKGGYTILGKSVGVNLMVFAAVKEVD